MDIHMTPHQRAIVEYHVITLGHNIAATRVESFRRGEIGLITNLLKLKGRAGWDSKISHLPSDPQRSLQQITQQPRDSDEQSIGYPICLTCPQCNTEYASNHINIKQQDLDIKSKCKSPRVQLYKTCFN